MADDVIIAELRLDMIPDDAIKEFRCRGGIGSSINIKIQKLKEPDKWGNEYFIAIDWGKGNHREAAFIGKGRRAPWLKDNQAAQQQTSKNRWARHDDVDEEPF
jgi:hypothetical protein